MFCGEGSVKILRGLGFHESSHFKGQSGYYGLEPMERRLNTLDNVRRFFSKEVFCSLTLDAAKDSPLLSSGQKNSFEMPSFTSAERNQLSERKRYFLKQVLCRSRRSSIFRVSAKQVSNSGAGRT